MAKRARSSSKDRDAKYQDVPWPQALFWSSEGNISWGRLIFTLLLAVMCTLPPVLTGNHVLDWYVAVELWP